MSALSLALQEAIHGQLSAALPDEVPVFDAVPTGGLPETYVLLGEGEARPARRVPGVQEHFAQVVIVTQQRGFATAKAIAAMVSDALAVPPILSEGRALSMRLVRERARRGKGQARRRVELTFRARIADE